MQIKMLTPIITVSIQMGKALQKFQKKEKGCLYSLSSKDLKKILMFLVIPLIEKEQNINLEYNINFNLPKAA